MHGQNFSNFFDINTGNGIATAETHQAFIHPPEVSSRGKMSD